MSVPKGQDTLWQRALPLLAGAALIVLFSRLSLWQLDRAEEKEALNALFDAEAPYAAIDSGEPPTLYAPIRVRGRFKPERQVLIDNIVRGGRVGYFVITPAETNVDERLLLVNRGWVPKTNATRPPSVDLSSGTEWRDLLGRAGRLPRVGIRSGAAFADSENWPRTAVYPDLDEIAAQLGEPLWPFILLLDAEDADGFQRAWKPEQSGPMTHYGYAFQWFAMALAVGVICGWQLWKRWGAR